MLEDPHTFHNPDYVVMESTYGDRNHDDRQDIKEDLAAVVNDAVAAGGHIIVPSSPCSGPRKCSTTSTN